MITQIYNLIIRLLLKNTFTFWQKLGFHITPNHYYQPIPDTRTLKDDLWQKNQSLLESILMRKTNSIFLIFLF